MSILSNLWRKYRLKDRVGKEAKEWLALQVPIVKDFLVHHGIQDYQAGELARGIVEELQKAVDKIL